MIAIERKGSWSKASLKFLKDHVHAVCVDLSDNLSKSPGEVPDRLVFPLEDGLQ